MSKEAVSPQAKQAALKIQAKLKANLKRKRRELSEVGYSKSKKQVLTQNAIPVPLAAARSGARTCWGNRQSYVYADVARAGLSKLLMTIVSW